MINEEFNTHKVIEINHSKSGVFELILERNELHFDPGDCVAIYSDKEKSRPYSISSEFMIIISLS